MKGLTYVVGRCSEHSQFAGSHEYLTEDDGWVVDVAKARHFGENDFCLAEEEKGTARYGKHRAEVVRDQSETVTGKTCYVFAHRPEVVPTVVESQPPKRNNPFG